MGFVEIDEKVLKEVKNITNTNYHNIGVFLPLDSIQAMIEDLLCEIDHWKEKYEDEVQDRKDNYRPLTHLEMEGVPERGPID